MRISDRVKTIASLEAVLSDTLGAVAVFALVNIAQVGLHHPAMLAHHLGRSVVIGAAGAIGIGIIWLNVLDLTRDRPLSYLLTFAVLLLLYAAVEHWHGSGPIAIVMFGLLTSNIDTLPTWLRVRSLLTDATTPEAAADETVRWFHAELTFLIRTFFYDYIGMLFRIEYLRGPVLTASILLTTGLLLARWIATATAVHIRSKREQPMNGSERAILCIFFPRGLVSAVLATVPSLHGLPNATQYLTYTIPIILTTNIIMTLGIFYLARRDTAPPDPSSTTQPVNERP
jgi:cell volume regulation protein A